jgi:hypothetical protein
MTVRLYAVLRLRPRSRRGPPPGLHGERLRILKCPEFSVVVADVRAALQPTVDNLLEFDRIIRALANVSDAILPARFGAVAGDMKTLKSEIADRERALTSALADVEGRVQMTVRVPNSPVHVGSGQPERKSKAGPGSKYLRNRAAASPSAAVTKLGKVLGDLVRAERIQPGPGWTSVYHLIENRDVARYRSRVPDFRVSGPFPPYAFVPGIDHTVWPWHDDQKDHSAKATKASRGTRFRAGGRGPGNTNR